MLAVTQQCNAACMHRLRPPTVLRAAFLMAELHVILTLPDSIHKKLSERDLLTPPLTLNPLGPRFAQPGAAIQAAAVVCTPS